VFGALGFAPAVPGTDTLALGSPLFGRVTLKLHGGTLDIRAPRAGGDRVYVRGVRLRGRPLRRTWLTWDDIARGGTLHFALTDKRGSAWGTAASTAPPSWGGATGAASCRAR
jgi:putative alpha-1,2-mannosidase